MNFNEDPLVSVRLMAYNHGTFLRQAIESVLMQRTNFPFELVIGDDFSSDNTSEVLNNYKTDERINILKREKGDSYWHKRQKFGRMFNFVDIVNNCKGKYIALLDGDDYWTDPLKLQKQVDILEANSDYSLCFHDVIILWDDKSKQPKYFCDKNQLDRSDIFKR